MPTVKFPKAVKKHFPTTPTVGKAQTLTHLQK
jgi:hypothetical protein